MMNTVETINEIQKFLEGKNEKKYVVNVEMDGNENFATCFIHEPNKEKRVEKIPFTSFIYMKDLKKYGHTLFNGNKEKYKIMLQKHYITIKKLKTGRQPRMENGYIYKVSSSKSYYSILNFFKEAGLSPYERIYDDNNKPLKDHRGYFLSKYRDLFYMPKLNEQFFISTGIRLFKGLEEYDDVHRVIYDIETTGLRFEHSRVFAIGVKDNRGYESVLKVDKLDDDLSEIKLIQEFFTIIDILKPAVISGYNSENFDYPFILGRMDILGVDIDKLPTTLHKDKKLTKDDSTVKFGNKTEYYKATHAYGYSILDIIHAVKKTAAVNTEIKNNKLKYICKFENLAKSNRMYIQDGKDIGRYWHENPTFILNKENNNYIEIPKEFKEEGELFYELQLKKNLIDEKEFEELRDGALKENPQFIKWLRKNGPKLFHEFSSIIGSYVFEKGKNILKRYLLDDLWETEQVDNLYNQSSFLLAKMTPTIYSRVSTMGTAAVWNLLMIAWSYENDLAIPHPDENENFSGGLARCYKQGYTKKLLKIDYASLYPMIQLTHDIFPMFDIDGVIKKMLIYMTTTRNIYKKLANSDNLKESEVELLKTIDHDTYDKYLANSFTKEERNLFKVKQLPIKILNNSLFGALGSGFAFNWSDNVSAARITTSGRIYLRQAIAWFKKFGLEPLLAVTDGINFGIPNTTTIRVTNEGISEEISEGTIDEMWKYNGKVGVSALIEKFNDEEMPKPYMSVDNDGEFESCYNISRINYALKTPKKIKLTGNTIKSKTLPGYIEDFIDISMEFILNGDGEGFINHYYDYSENIYYKQIPLKKIASKSKFKTSLDNYINRGTDKNGKLKAKQAHMELVIADRENIARKIFEDDFDKFKDDDDRKPEDYDIMTIIDIVETYMPPEPELDTMLYYVNVGTRKSHGDVKADPKTGETLVRAKLINTKDLENNPDMIGEYNVEKYLAAFNKRVEVLLDGFDPEIRKDILVEIKRKKIKDVSGEKVEVVELKKNEFKTEQLKLSNFNLDDYDESMCLETKEIDFWNRTGLNPNLIWDGFNTIDDDKHGLLYPKVYDFAIGHLTDIMIKKGKPPLKSINDELGHGDYILIRNTIKIENDDPNYNKYHVKNNRRPIYNIGYFNGKHIEILKEDVNVPLSPIEEEWKRIELEKEKKLENLKINSDDAIKKELDEIKKENNLFKDFLIKFGLDPRISKEELFNKAPKSETAFNDFIHENEISVPDDVYFDEDDLQ